MVNSNTTQTSLFHLRHCSFVFRTESEMIKMLLYINHLLISINMNLHISPQVSSACAHVYAHVCVYVLCRSLNVRSAVLQKNVAVDPWCYAHEIIDLNFTIIQQSSNDLSYP